MFVVPVKGDRITVKDSGGKELVVSSYTNMKTDPGVYVVNNTPGTDTEVIFFQDIEQINGVSVVLNRTAKVFEAQGPLKRKFNLPQPGDTIIITRLDVPIGSPDENVIVKHLKLHSQQNRGMGMLVSDGSAMYRLTDIISIDRKIGSERFDRVKFQRYYFDYLPFDSKAKVKANVA